MEGPKPRVLIVEDELLIAEDIRAYLEEVDYEVTGVAGDSTEAIAELRYNTPDIALLDINLNSELDGIEIADLVNQEMRIPFIFLTSYSDRATIDRAKHTRPYGYVVKPFDESDLFTAIEIALFNFQQREIPVNYSLETLNAKLLSALTEREFEILQDMQDGLTNQQLAARHYVSVNTVKTHIKRIYDKLDVNSRIAVIKKLRELTG